jgi:hypothetical protein
MSLRRNTTTHGKNKSHTGRTRVVQGPTNCATLVCEIVPWEPRKGKGKGKGKGGGLVYALRGYQNLVEVPPDD